MPDSKEKSAPKVNDVAKPGETPSSPTSRPIITTSGEMIKQDPMVVKNEEANVNPINQNGPDKLSKKTNIKIEPPKNDSPEEQTPDETKSEPSEESPPKQSSPTTSEEPQENDAPKPAEETPEKEDSASSDTAAIDSLASTAETQKLSAKQDEDQQKRTQQIKELISSRKYAVPIVEGGHKASSQRFMTWLFLFLLLVAIGTYLAIDAGFLDVGVSLPYDLIKN